MAGRRQSAAQRPHTLDDLTAEEWTHPYTREEAAFPGATSAGKYWPPVGRIDNVHGDRNLGIIVDAEGTRANPTDSLKIMPQHKNKPIKTKPAPALAKSGTRNVRY